MRGEMDKFPSGWRWGNVIEYKRRVLLERKDNPAKPLLFGKSSN